MKTIFKEKLKLKYLFYIFLFLLIATFNSLNLKINYFYTSDDIKNYQITTSLEKWKESLEISWKWNEIFKDFENITFIPSIKNIDDITYNNQTVETSRDGFPELNFYLWTIWKIYFWEYFLYIINLFLIFFLFVLIYFIFKTNKSIIIILWSFSIFLFWWNFLMSNILGIFYFWVFLYLFFRYKNKYLMMFVFILSSILVRYELILIYAVLVALSIIHYFFKNYSIKKSIIIWLFIVLLWFIIIYFTFYLDNIYNTKFTNRLTEHILYIFQLRTFGNLITNINQYMIPIFPLFFIWIIWFIKWFNFRKLIFLYIILFIWFFFFKNADYWWFWMNWLSSSYVRYMLPVYLLMLIWIILYFLKYKSKVILIIIFTFLFISGLLNILNYRFWLFHIKNLSDHEKNAINKIISNYWKWKTLLIDWTWYYSNFVIDTDRIKLAWFKWDINYLIQKSINNYDNIIIIESNNIWWKKILI